MGKVGRALAVTTLLLITLAAGIYQIMGLAAMVAAGWDGWTR